MIFVIPGAILLFCLPVVFAPRQSIRWIFFFALSACLLGGLICLWPQVMPQDFIANHPWAANSPLHPKMAAFSGVVIVTFSFGLLLALLSRSLLLYFRILKAR